MNDKHDKLVQAYLEYFKASEWWERNKSVRAYAAVQKQLRNIRTLAKERNTEIRLTKKDIDSKRKKGKDKLGN